MNFKTLNLFISSYKSENKNIYSYLEMYYSVKGILSN